MPRPAAAAAPARELAAAAAEAPVAAAPVAAEEAGAAAAAAPAVPEAAASASLVAWRRSNEAKEHKDAYKGADLAALQLLEAQAEPQQHAAALAALLAAAAHSAERLWMAKDTEAAWGSRAEERVQRALRLCAAASPLPHALLVAGRVCERRGRHLQASWYYARCERFAADAAAAARVAALSAFDCREAARDAAQQLRAPLQAALHHIKVACKLRPRLESPRLEAYPDEQSLQAEVLELLSRPAHQVVSGFSEEESRKSPASPAAAGGGGHMTVRQHADSPAKVADHAAALLHAVQVVPLATGAVPQGPDAPSNEPSLVVASWNMQAMSPLVHPHVRRCLSTKVAALAALRDEGACLIALQEAPGPLFGADAEARRRNMRDYVAEHLVGWGYDQADTGAESHAEAHGFAYDTDKLALLAPPAAYPLPPPRGAAGFVRAPVLALFHAAKDAPPDAPVRALGTRAVVSVHLKARSSKKQAKSKQPEAAEGGDSGEDDEAEAAAGPARLNELALAELRQLPDVVRWAEREAARLAGGAHPARCTVLLLGDFNLALAHADNVCHGTFVPPDDLALLRGCGLRCLLQHGDPSPTTWGPPVTLVPPRCYDAILIKTTSHDDGGDGERRRAPCWHVDADAASFWVHRPLRAELALVEPLAEQMRAADAVFIKDLNEKHHRLDAAFAEQLRSLVSAFRYGLRMHVTGAWSDHLPLLARLPLRPDGGGGGGAEGPRDLRREFAAQADGR